MHWYIEVDLTENDPAAREKEYGQYLETLSPKERAAEEEAFERGESNWNWILRQAKEAQDAIAASVSPDGTLELYLPYSLDYLSWDQDAPENNRVEWNQPGGMLKMKVKIR